MIFVGALLLLTMPLLLIHVSLTLPLLPIDLSLNLPLLPIDVSLTLPLLLIDVSLIQAGADVEDDTVIPVVDVRNKHNLLTPAICPTEGILCNVEPSAKSHSEETFQRLLLAFSHCAWGPFVFVTYDNINKTNKEHIRHSISSATSNYALDYVIGGKDIDVIEDIIWTAYFTHEIRDFVLMSTNSEIFHILERVLRNKQCANAALVANNARFIVVTSVNNMLGFEDKLRESSFDNVVVVSLDQEDSALEGGVYTLMWRADRLRELQEVDSQQDSLARCQLFPNINTGLNGRHFVGIAKVWQPEFSVIQNHVTGKLEFSGFYSDIFDVLAKYLNFTYTLEPQPGEADDITWEKYAEIVSECQVDFGINLFLSNAKLPNNITTSFPVLFNDYIGVYKNKRKPNPYKLFLVFRVETFGVIFGCLVYTMLLYIMYLYILQQGLDSKKTTTGEQKSAQETADEQLQARRQRSSIFEIDWQSKYQRVMPETSGLNVDYQLDSELYFSSTYSSYTNKDVDNIHSIICHTNKKKTTRINKMRIRHSRKGHVKKIRKRRNAKTAQLPHVGDYRGQRAEIYNNESHYTIDFTSAHFLSIISHETESTLVVQRHSHLQSISSQKTAPKRHHRREKENGRRPSYGWSNYDYIIDLLFRLFGTILNMDTLPQPDHCAPRILLSAWSLVMIVVIATYTGNLTASFVDNSVIPSIKTFDELVSLTDFRWGVSNQSTAYSTMKSAAPGTVLHKLYEGIQRFSQSDPSVQGNIEDMIRNIRSGKFVALVASFTLSYLTKYTDLTDLAVINDKLLTANGGFIFPKNTEFSFKISDHIVKMMDAGVINELFLQHFRKYNATMTVVEETENVYLDFENVLGVFYISGCGVGLALLALVGEVLFCKFKAERTLTGESNIRNYP